MTEQINRKLVLLLALDHAKHLVNEATRSLLEPTSIDLDLDILMEELRRSRAIVTILENNLGWSKVPVDGTNIRRHDVEDTKLLCMKFY